jgi:hypothetical protein
VKHGSVWRIQLTYFALHPSNRELTVAEGADRIDVLDGGKVLFSFTPMRNAKVSSTGRWAGTPTLTQRNRVAMLR